MQSKATVYLASLRRYNPLKRNVRQKMSRVKSSTSTHVRVIGIPPHAGDEIYDEIVHRLSKLGGATIHKNKTLYYVDAHFNSSDMAQLAVEQFSAVNIPSGENLQCKMVETDNEREKKRQLQAVYSAVKALRPDQQDAIILSFRHFIGAHPEDAEALLLAYPAALLGLKMLVTDVADIRTEN